MLIPLKGFSTPVWSDKDGLQDKIYEPHAHNILR